MSVDFVAARGKWRARISVNSRRIDLGGSFATREEAETVYAAALANYAPERVRKARACADPRERFFSKTRRDEATGCLLWTCATDKDGYGKFQLNGGGKQTHVRVHRYAYFLAHGAWPSESVLHSCDTPGCVEATHLSDGSQSENLIQCAVRGRRAAIKLTVDRVREIRRRHAGGASVTVMAAEMGISRETLFAVVHRRTWRHVA